MEILFIALVRICCWGGESNSTGVVSRRVHFFTCGTVAVVVVLVLREEENSS